MKLEGLLRLRKDAVVERWVGDVIALQELTAPQAVGFVFGLKDAIRAEIGPANGDPDLWSQLADLERRIDEIALAAFDVFVECREKVCELRVNEVKRQVAWATERQSQ